MRVHVQLHIQRLRQKTSNVSLRWINNHRLNDLQRWRGLAVVTSEVKGAAKSTSCGEGVSAHKHLSQDSQQVIPGGGSVLMCVFRACLKVHKRLFFPHVEQDVCERASQAERK